MASNGPVAVIIEHFCRILVAGGYAVGKMLLQVVRTSRVEVSGTERQELDMNGRKMRGNSFIVNALTTMLLMYLMAFWV